MKVKVKNVVKVMNFHSLLRVDSSRRRAEKYFEYEKQLSNFANVILNNRNFILDKKMLKTNDKAKILNIYIGNDLGFCGNFNSNINDALRKDKVGEKILIGKKISKKHEKIILSVTKDEYEENMKKIEEILYDGISEGKYKEINVIYNRYYNISDIQFEKKRLYPLDKAENTNEAEYKDDFVVEGDLSNILKNIIVLYLLYEIKVATDNSFASENIMRQRITKESIRKIEELEEDYTRKERKEEKNKSFKRTLDNIIKLKIKGDI